MGNPETKNAPKQPEQQQKQVKITKIENDSETTAHIQQAFGVDFNEPKKENKAFYDVCQQIYSNGGYGAEFFKIVATDGNINALNKEVVKQYMVSLASQLKQIENTKEEDIIVTKEELITSMTDVHNSIIIDPSVTEYTLTSSDKEAVDSHVVQHLEAQQEETVTNAEAWNGFDTLSKKNQEMVEEAHDATTMGIADKLGGAFMDEANNMATGMIMGRWSQKMSKFLESEKPQEGGESESAGFTFDLSGVFGEDLSRTQMENIFKQGPLGLNGPEILRLADTEDNPGHADRFYSMMQWLSDTANSDGGMVDGHPLLQDPRLFSHVLSYVVDRDQNSLKVLTDIISSNNGVVDITDQSNVASVMQGLFEGFEDSDVTADQEGLIESLDSALGSVDVQGLSAENQQAVGKLVDGLKEVKSGGNFMTGIRKMIQSVKVMFGPLIDQISGLFGDESIKEGFDNIILTLDGGLSPTQETAMSAGMTVLSSSVLSGSQLASNGTYDLLAGDNAAVMSETIVEQFFDNPSGLTKKLNLSRSDENKLFRNASPEVKGVRPSRQLADLFLYNMKNITAPGSGKNIITSENRKVEDGEVYYGGSADKDSSKESINTIVSQYVRNRGEKLSAEFLTEGVGPDKRIQSLMSGMIKDATASKYVMFTSVERRTTQAKNNEKLLDVQKEAQLDEQATKLKTDASVIQTQGDHILAYDAETNEYTLTNKDNPNQSSIIGRSRISKELQSPTDPTLKVTQPDAGLLAQQVTAIADTFRDPNAGVEIQTDNAAEAVLQDADVIKALTDHSIKYDDASNTYILSKKDDVSITYSINRDEISSDGEVHVPTLITKISDTIKKREV